MSSIFLHIENFVGHHPDVVGNVQGKYIKAKCPAVDCVLARLNLVEIEFFNPYPHIWTTILQNHWVRRNVGVVVLNIVIIHCIGYYYIVNQFGLWPKETGKVFEASQQIRRWHANALQPLAKVVKVCDSFQDFVSCKKAIFFFEERPFVQKSCQVLR